MQLLTAVLDRFGDFIYDATLSFVPDSLRAEQTFRSVLRKLSRELKTSMETPLEVPKTLQITHSEIARYAAPKHKGHPDSLFGEKTRITPSDRLKHFDRYFDALPLLERWILFCELKHRFPSAVVADSLAMPLPSYELTRDQALRSLERGIWQ